MLGALLKNYISRSAFGEKGEPADEKNSKLGERMVLLVALKKNWKIGRKIQSLAIL